MIRGIGASVRGMAVEQRRSEVIANNVANVNTDGFKRSVAVSGEFEQMLLHRLGDGAGSGDSGGAVGLLGHGAEVVEIVEDPTPGAPLEGGGARSNVDLAQELTDLIITLRSFQANQRALTMQDRTLGRAVSDLGKV